MKRLLVVLFLLMPAASSFAEIRTVRIVFTSCLRGACLADATNAVKDAKIGVVGKLRVIHLDDGTSILVRRDQVSVVSHQPTSSLDQPLQVALAPPCKAFLALEGR